MASDWNPELYLQFEKERGRPCADLVARVGTAPKTVLDVGCGPGNSAGTALARWPDARVTGLDTSPAMIEAARQAFPEHEWLVGDARSWNTDRVFDLVLSNAALQWMPDHAVLVRRLLKLVAPGGVLAVQIPRYGSMPVSALVDRWFHELAPGNGDLTCASMLTCESPAFYAEVLGTGYELWETAYHHRMPHHAAIADMLRSTGLRPYLDRLTPQRQTAFEQGLIERLPELYPAGEGGVLFPFQRLFFIAGR